MGMLDAVVTVCLPQEAQPVAYDLRPVDRKALSFVQLQVVCFSLRWACHHLTVGPPAPHTATSMPLCDAKLLTNRRGGTDQRTQTRWGLPVPRQCVVCSEDLASELQPEECSACVVAPLVRAFWSGCQEGLEGDVLVPQNCLLGPREPRGSPRITRKIARGGVLEPITVDALWLVLTGPPSEMALRLVSFCDQAGGPVRWELINIRASHVCACQCQAGSDVASS